jgi:hypothetical protein
VVIDKNTIFPEGKRGRRKLNSKQLSVCHVENEKKNGDETCTSITFLYPDVFSYPFFPSPRSGG